MYRFISFSIFIHDSQRERISLILFKINGPPSLRIYQVENAID